MKSTNTPLGFYFHLLICGNIENKTECAAKVYAFLQERELPGTFSVSEKMICIVCINVFFLSLELSNVLLPVAKHESCLRSIVSAVRITDVCRHLSVYIKGSTKALFFPTLECIIGFCTSTGLMSVYQLA